jgi:RNA polymerase-binding transcription factor
MRDGIVDTVRGFPGKLTAEWLRRHDEPISLASDPTVPRRRLAFGGLDGGGEDAPPPREVHAGTVAGEDALARLLAAEKANAAEQIASLTEDLDRLIQSSVGTNADDEHDPEGATIAFERAQLAALLAASRQRLADLDRATARLAAGTYGRCESCSQPINADRLTARPTTTSCVRCATTRR